MSITVAIASGVLTAAIAGAVTATAMLTIVRLAERRDTWKGRMK